MIPRHVYSRRIGARYGFVVSTIWKIELVDIVRGIRFRKLDAEINGGTLPGKQNSRARDNPSSPAYLPLPLLLLSSRRKSIRQV